MYNKHITQPVYQGECCGATIELWFRKYACPLPYYLKVDGAIVLECDELRIAYFEYNETFKRIRKENKL